MTPSRLPDSLAAQQARVTAAIDRILPADGVEPSAVH